jgi:predicted nucleic acid-binding protein
VIYLDSSALFKLVIEESETAALRQFLRDRAGEPHIASALIRTEVVRAVARRNPGAVLTATHAVAKVTTIPVTTELLDTAAALQPPLLRSLDAIHLASALRFRDILSAFIAYDDRLHDAARQAGLPVTRPAAPAVPEPARTRASEQEETTPPPCRSAR